MAGRAASVLAAVALVTAALLVLPAIMPAVPAVAADREAPLGVGEAAPDLTLGDQHGRPLRLAEALRHRDFVVLAFYVKAFTGG